MGSSFCTEPSHLESFIVLFFRTNVITHLFLCHLTLLSETERIWSNSRQYPQVHVHWFYAVIEPVVQWEKREHYVCHSGRVVSVYKTVADIPFYFKVIGLSSERKYLTTHLDNRHVKTPELGLSLCTLQNMLFFFFSWWLMPAVLLFLPYLQLGVFIGSNSSLQLNECWTRVFKRTHTNSHGSASPQASHCYLFWDCSQRQLSQTWNLIAHTSIFS